MQVPRSKAEAGGEGWLPLDAPDELPAGAAKGSANPDASGSAAFLGGAREEPQTWKRRSAALPTRLLMAWGAAGPAARGAVLTGACKSG